MCYVCIPPYSLEIYVNKSSSIIIAGWSGDCSMIQHVIHVNVSAGPDLGTGVFWLKFCA